MSLKTFSALRKREITIGRAGATSRTSGVIFLYTVDAEE